MAVIMPDPSKAKSTPPGPPVLTFYGPDNTSQIKALNPNGFEVARFTTSGDKKDWTLSRLTSPSTPPILICSAHKGSLSSTVRMDCHGVELKFTDAEKLVPELTAPFGKFQWKSDSSFGEGGYKLVNEGKSVVAGAQTKGDLRLEVYVQGDEQFFDCLLAGWVAFHGYLVRSRKVTGALEVVAQVAGGGGA